VAIQQRLKLIGVALLVGLICAGSRAGSNVPPSIGELTAADVVRLAEIEQVLARFGNEIWPGWSPSPPLVLRKGEFDYLIGHPSPPQPFEQILGASIGDRPVFLRKEHLVPVPAATTWEVTGVWCVAVPALEEFQREIDEQLGPNIVNLDDAAYARVAVHEGFHAFALTAIGGMDNLPDFGAEVDAQRTADILAAIPDLDARYAAEGQALRDGLAARTEEDARRAAAAFLQARQSRRANHSDLISFERLLEWTEGLARYADVSLMQLAGSPDYAGTIQYPDAARAWQEFLAQLSDPAAIPTGLRDRYAILGADHITMLSFRPCADQFTLVFYDHRYNGRSTGADLASLTWENLAADADALRQALGFEKWAVLGHSIGGMVALEYALRYPESLSHLVLLDTCDDIRWAQEKAPELLAQRGYSPDTVKLARRFFNGQIAPREMMPTLMKLGSAYYPHGLSFLQLAHLMVSGLSVKLRPEALIFGYGQSLRGWTAMDRLGEIKVPALVLAGREDFLFPPEHQAELAAGITNAHLEIIERAGHNAHEERPAEVIRAVRGFMAGVNPGCV
jgi:proline iminopeptidase